MITESIRPHFIRWCKLEYGTPENDDSGHATGLDVLVILHEAGSMTFEELQHEINYRDTSWEDSWNMYKKYNRL